MCTTLSIRFAKVGAVYAPSRHTFFFFTRVRSQVTSDWSGSLAVVAAAKRALFPAHIFPKCRTRKQTGDTSHCDPADEAIRSSVCRAVSSHWWVSRASSSASSSSVGFEITRTRLFGCTARLFAHCRSSNACVVSVRERKKKK